MELRKTIDDVRNFIPFNLRGNFDKNSRYLKIEFIESKSINTEYNETVEYNFETNTIYLNKKTIQNIQSKEEKEEKLRHSLIKGLLLMSSTNYKRNKAINIGFGSIERYGLFKEFNTVSNIGLTAGYTELIACTIEERNIEYIKNHPLALQILFSKQIEMIVGENVMQEAYFKENKNKIEKTLSKIDSEISGIDLLENITNVLYKKAQGIDYIDEVIDIQKKLKILFKKTKHNEKTKEEFEKYTIDPYAIKIKVKQLQKTL